MLTSDKVLEWARENKKRIVQDYLSECEYPRSDSPNVIFMAGAPGAGKTEFAKRLIPQLSVPPIHIDMDEIAKRIDDYNPKNSHLFRAGATVILERLYDEAIDKGIDILMDGTFGHSKTILNVERALKHRYNIRIYFISPDPFTAWNKTLDREIIEKRSINAEQFVETYFHMLENLRKINEKFGKHVPISVVLKDDQNRLKDIIENISTVENYLQPVLTRSQLIATIKS
jgi:predicted ABC-type ATPase